MKTGRSLNAVMQELAFQQKAKRDYIAPAVGMRLVCTNGMMVNDLGQRKYHTGRATKAVEDSFEVYTDETIEAEDKAFLLKLRDTTMAAIEESHLADLLKDIKEADFDLGFTGFDAAEIDDLFSNVHSKEIKAAQRKMVDRCNGVQVV